MRTIRLLVWFLLIGWAAASIGFVLGLRLWYREREGRGGPIPVSQVGMFTSPQRRRIHPPRETLIRFGVKEGSTVLELGPGPGYFTPYAGTLVGVDGRVISLDLQPGMLALLQERLREYGTTNAFPIAGDATRLPFANRSLDVAFLVAVLGEVPDRPAALAELRRVLKPGGTLGFLETLSDPDYVFVDTMKDLCRAFGFDLIDHQRQRLGYTMTFTAPS
jgi:ubiquinone/menaquinone biosynthesis C-methylase UbiE